MSNNLGTLLVGNAEDNLEKVDYDVMLKDYSAIFTKMKNFFMSMSKEMQIQTIT